jgi:hypothetical protein
VRGAVVAGGRLIGGIKTHARERAAYAFKTGWQRRRKHFERLSQQKNSAERATRKAFYAAKKLQQPVEE